MMNRKGFLVAALLLAACGNGNDQNSEGNGGSDSYQQLAAYFPSAALPYELTEQALAGGTEKAIPAAVVQQTLPDTVLATLGKGSKTQYRGLAKIKSGTEEYLVLKAGAAKSGGAYVLVFNSRHQFAGFLPFLVPDKDASTTQKSVIDKNASIVRQVTRKKGSAVVAEGKDVFAWDAASGKFSWVVTDPLDEDQELVNPIDTLPRKHRLAGDYVKDKRNVVFVRDGRYPNQLEVFIHTEKNEGACKGELKGTFLITSSTTAVYRQAGDPCVLQLNFSGNIVTLNEQQGCGNYRGLDCPFSGSFRKRKKQS